MTQRLQEVPPDPFYYGYCPVKSWKKVKKRYKEHHYEIIDPRKVGLFMEFKFISQQDYMSVISGLFLNNGSN